MEIVNLLEHECGMESTLHKLLILVKCHLVASDGLLYYGESQCSHSVLVLVLVCLIQRLLDKQFNLVFSLLIVVLIDV
jgi:hypothetical protein